MILARDKICEEAALIGKSCSLTVIDAEEKNGGGYEISVTPGATLKPVENANSNRFKTKAIKHYSEAVLKPGAQQNVLD